MKKTKSWVFQFCSNLMSNFRGIKGKVIGTTISIAVLLLAVGGFGIFTAKKVSDTYSKVAEVYEPATKHLVGVLAQAREVILIVNMLTTAGEDQGLISDLNGQYDTAVNKFNDEFEVVKKMYIQLNDEASFDELREKWKPILNASNELMALSFSQNPEDKKKFAEIVHGEFTSSRLKFIEVVQKQIEQKKILAENEHNKAKDTIKQSNQAIVGVVVLGFILSVFLGYFVSAALSKKLLMVSKELSAGAAEVASAAMRIQTVSENLSTSASEQAASMEQTTTSTTELNAMVAKNAESAASSKQVSKEGREGAERGKSMVSHLVTKMDDISQSNSDIAKQVQASNEALQNIILVIKQISSKTQVINDIVFQTKLLSFNAAVEAARAGEHGKGFAVVADEVGKLAAMSGASAKEISSMLTQSTQQVEKIITETKSKVTDLINTGSKKIEEGVLEARKSEQTLDEIATSIVQVDAMVSEIAEASSNQASGVNEISKAINQLQGLTQTNVSVSHEASSSASQLTANARSLANMAAELLFTVTGSRSEQENESAKSTDDDSGQSFSADHSKVA